MNGIRHPFTGALYESDGEGRVIVTNGDGSSGVFASSGRWLRGTVREADPQLCGWVGGPRFHNHRVGAARQLPAS